MTHSFPTRRSSDLCYVRARGVNSSGNLRTTSTCSSPATCQDTMKRAWSAMWSFANELDPTHPPQPAGARRRPGRSEENTSELQSLMRISYAVFRLQKKTTNKAKKLKNETDV